MLIAAVSVTWALASPDGSGPDEPPHVVRVASIAEGQLVGDDDPVERGGSRLVSVPAIIANLNYLPECYKFVPRRSATCAPDFVGTNFLIDTRTPAGAAPPLYYALVSPPLWLATSARAVEAVRVLSALISAALIAWAVTLARAAGLTKFFLVGLFLSLTPSTFFITGVVNPSSLEISAALLLWTSAIILLVDPDSKSERLQRALVIAAGVSGVLLVQTRQLSPLWLALIGGTIFVATTWKRIVAAARRVDVRLAAGAVVVAALLAVVWLRVEKPLTSQRALGIDKHGFDAIAFALGHLGYVYRSGISRFGWMDYEAPTGVAALWTIAVAVLVLLGLTVASGRLKLAILTLGAASIIVPVLIEASQLDTLGPTWQGRYTLPLIMGVPLLCGLALERLEANVGRVLVRLLPWLIGAMAIAQILGFFFTLRRYVVGSNGRIWFLNANGWEPSVPLEVLLVMIVVTVGLLYGWLATLAFKLGDRTVRSAG